MTGQRQMRAGVAAILAAAGVVVAQDQPTPPLRQPAPAGAREALPRAQPAPGEAPPVTFSISARGELGFNSDLDNANGDVTVSRVGLGLESAIVVGERGRLTLNFDYEHSNYDFNDATDFIPGSSSPFREINRETFSASFYRQESQQWGWLVGGSVGVSAEDGAKLGDSIFGSGYAGFRYAVTERLFLGTGINVATRLEDNLFVWPLLVFDWQIADQWRLSNEGRPGLTLSYLPSERWAIYLAGEYQYRDFRLDEDGPAPSGVGRDTRVPIMIGARFKPTANLSFEGGLGAYFFQNYEVDDSGGNKITDIDANATPFVQLRLSYRF